MDPVPTKGSYTTDPFRTLPRLAITKANSASIDVGPKYERFLSV
jgi:hypothetical protein